MLLSIANVSRFKIPQNTEGADTNTNTVIHHFRDKGQFKVNSNCNDSNQCGHTCTNQHSSN